MMAWEMWATLAMAVVSSPATSHAATALIPAHTLEVDGMPPPALGLESLRPRLSWRLATGARQGSARVNVSRIESPGSTNTSGSTWSTGKMKTSDMFWDYDGPALLPETLYMFTVEWWDELDQAAPTSRQVSFETGVCVVLPSGGQRTGCAVGVVPKINSVDRFNASWIGMGNMTRSGVRLRTEFNLPPSVKVLRARAYFSGQGWGDLYLNCARVDPTARLNPAWSNTFLYSTFDVTAMIQPGARNAVAIELGHGKSAKFSGENPFTGPPALQKVGLAALLRLRIDLSNGSTVVIATSRTGWAASASGPYTSQDIYDGVNYDARREQSGWCNAGFDQAGWTHPVDLSAPKAVPPGIAGSMSHVTSQFFPLIRDIEVLHPITVVHLDDVAVYDFGSNSPGVVVLTNILGRVGANVSVRTGEIQNLTTGRVVFTSNAGAMAWDNYTLGNLINIPSHTVASANARNTATFSPRFTYHGFRFAEVYSNNKAASVGGAEAHVATSSVPVVGTFVASASAPLLTGFYNATMLSLRGHLMGFPEDCPVRSERQPWGADMALVASTAAINYDLRAFYSNTLREIASGGMYIGTGSPLWGLGPYFIADAMRAQYGDDRRMALNNGSMDAQARKFLQLVVSPTSLRTPPLDYGDWAASPRPAEGVPVAKWSSSWAADRNLSCAFGVVTTLANMANVLQTAGNASGAALYNAAADAGRSQFHAAYWHDGNGTYGSGSATASVLPLALNATPVSDRHTAELALLSRLDADGYHLYSGIWGWRYLPEVLTAMGRTDVALRMLAEVSTYPSFGFEFEGSLETPSTTLWENINAPLAVGQHGSAASRNHAMFGGPANWLTERVAGLAQAPALELIPDPGGYASVYISPADGLGTSVSGASAEVESVRGRVAASWTRTGGMHCTLASNYTIYPATVNCGGSGSEGGVITSVTAIYGDPSGGCMAPQRNAACDWAGAQALAEHACVGKSECLINVTSLAALATPTSASWCAHPPTTTPTALHFVLMATCSQPMGYRVNATVPAGANGTVAIPMLGLQNVTVTANDTIVWQNGAFVRPPHGVLPAVRSGTLDAAHQRVVFDVVTGILHFTLSGTNGTIVTFTREWNVCDIQNKPSAEIDVACPQTNHTILSVAEVRDVQGSDTGMDTKPARAVVFAHHIETRCIGRHACTVTLSPQTLGFRDPAVMTSHQYDNDSRGASQCRGTASFSVSCGVV